MLEQTNGTYEETTDTEWPSEGYSFNKHMSGCIDSNGNTIENTLTYKNGTIKLKTKHNTYCYIYFDIDRPATEELLATVSSEQLWDSTLEDDGYRYVGTNPNNYICFGTTDQEECMNDTDKYMYRIIGIFEDSNGMQHLKLIKKEALNETYAWHSENVEVNWQESTSYSGLNGNYFLTNSEYSYMQDDAWNNIITTWEYTVANTKTYEIFDSNGIGSSSYHFQGIASTYLHEMNRGSKINATCYYASGAPTSCDTGDWKEVTTKIGLMYVSDYQLSLGEKSLNFMNNDIVDYETMKTGWTHINNNDSNAPLSYEWVLAIRGLANGYYCSYEIVPDGFIDAHWCYAELSVRPVFYLEADTKLDKGTGTIGDPYTIKISPNLKEYCEEYNNINECIENEENDIEEVSDLWNSTLEEDGIRYVGTNPNNYVCFGTTNTTECTGDTDKYMYRIIGIFKDDTGNNHLKLIKKEALNTAYAWHSDYSLDTDWDESDLYKGLNGSYFLSNTTYSYAQDTKWTNKIAEWNYTATNTKTYENYKITGTTYGPNYYYQVIRTTYLHEMNRSNKSKCYYTTSVTADCNIEGSWKTVKGKIGLMYVSDYQLSLGSTVLDYTNNVSTNYRVMKTSWMHLSNNDSEVLSTQEWTMSRFGFNSNSFYTVWRVHSDGLIDDPGVGGVISSRPVFYLTENIKITSGKGSITEPFIIS